MIPNKEDLYNVSIPNRQDIIDLYSSNCKSIKQLASYFGVGERTINKWFSFYNIVPIRGAERKNIKLREKPLTNIQKQFLVGTMLGDGHICGNKTKRFVACHSISNKEYLMWKKQILSDFVPRLYEIKQKNRNSTICSFSTIAHPQINEVYDLFYDGKAKVIRENIQDYLTEFGLAIWYMDDGSTRKYDMKLCTEGFTYTENQILTKILYKKFGICAKIRFYNKGGKKYNYLSFNKKNSIILTEIIKPYVIECMKYKLLNQSSTTLPQTSLKDDDKV